jgi:hypothetical protein
MPIVFRFICFIYFSCFVNHIAFSSFHITSFQEYTDHKLIDQDSKDFHHAISNLKGAEEVVETQPENEHIHYSKSDFTNKFNKFCSANYSLIISIYTPSLLEYYLFFKVPYYIFYCTCKIPFTI